MKGSFVFTVFLIMVLLIWRANAVLPAYSPAIEGLPVADVDDLLHIVWDYFRAGYTVPVMSSFLFYRHGIRRSVRHLKRMLAQLGLRRRCQESPEEDIIHAIEGELQGSGSCCGYRAMWQRLNRHHMLHVRRETVRHLLRELDPEGVDTRSRQRFRRRIYRNKGPNFLIHIDGYDKLKPYGFAIHGGIDGFSRRILWVEVGPTNNDPKAVAKYFVDYVHKIKGVPHIIRSDRGTENTLIENIQIAFRYYHGDERCRFKSFMYGKSTANQRIERWWGSLRTGSVDFWIRLFKDMCHCGALDNTCSWQIECMRFCFTGVLRAELQRVAQLWNEHHIRPCRNSVSPSGKPDEMYFLPQLFGSQDYKHEVPIADVEAVQTMFTPRNPYGCSLEFAQVGELIIRDNGMTMPQTPKEAVVLYLRLKAEIVHLMGE